MNKDITSKQKGNEGEEYVNSILRNSFLDYWCYPSPLNENGNKKEICDCMILFKAILIMVSVKNHTFMGKYDKYFKKTIYDATNQINGAERLLFGQNKDVYIKHPKKEKERIPIESIQKVYRIIVNLGEGVNFYPFQQETKNQNYVSIFDKSSFQTILKELDTIPDFVEYLEKREEWFKGKDVIILPCEEDEFDENTAEQFFELHEENISNQRVIMSGTEQDFLAYYLNNNRNFFDPKVTEAYDTVHFPFDGEWKKYITDPEVTAKKKADEQSYFIDQLVEKDILYSGYKKSQELATSLMTFKRFFRRIIVKALFDFYEEYSIHPENYFAKRYIVVNDIGFVFVFFSQKFNVNLLEEYLEYIIDCYSLFTNYEQKTIILIGVTNEFAQQVFEIKENIIPFSKEKEDEIKSIIKKFDWFTNLTYKKASYKEYPTNPNTPNE